MGEITRVYLITGFLGSGKTTFLNRIIQQFPKDRKLTLLINEFGEIGVDGTLVEGEDIDTMEISKGSIFCVCVKTDFIKGLYALNTTIRPDVLLIESTGVANPTDLKKDLALPIFSGRFQFCDQFCIIDGAHFLDAYEAYVSVEKQIASSTVFIINKIDITPTESIEQIKALVRRHHPKPVFYETTFADIPLERFGFAMTEGETTEIPASFTESIPGPLSEEALERFIDDLLDSPELEITPPDPLVSAAYRWSGSDVHEVREMAAKLPPSLVRAKGFVEDGKKTKLFSYVMGDWTIEDVRIPRDRIQYKNIVVFIGPPDAMDDVEAATRGGAWTGMGVLQPYSPDRG